MRLAILLILLFTNVSWASQRITTKSIQDFYDFVIKKKAEVGLEQILVVYDFDNTLMAMNQDIGSDQWYNWQAGLIRGGKSKDAVVESMSELFELHYKIAALGRMHLLETQTKDVVQKIQEQKIKSMILTSRGSGLRNDIEGELSDADLDFKMSSIGPEGGYPSTFRLEGVEKSREISFMNGIAMGSGQNKGLVLKAILKKTNSKFKVIAFLDDTLKNIENVENELKEEVDLNTFYYTHEEERVKKFEKDKSQAQKEWKKLKPVLKIFD